MLDDRENVPGGDAVLRLLDPGLAELLFDHELLDGAGVAAVGLGPVRHGVAVVDECVLLLGGVEPLHFLDEGQHLAADLLALLAEVDLPDELDALAGEADDGGQRVVSVDDGFERGGAAHVEVRVVLPREADAAVHLLVEVDAQVGRRHGEAGGDRGGEAELVAAVLGLNRRVPHRGGRQLGGDGHVGAVVLDALVHRDDSPELHAHLGVLGGHVGGLAADADGFGGADEPGVVDQLLGAAQHGGCRHVGERDLRRRARRVDVRRRFDLHARVMRVDDHDRRVALAHEDVGELGAEHDAGVARRLAVLDLDVAAERDRALDRPVGQTGQVLLLRGRLRGGVNGGAGDHRRDERAGRELASELFDHDDQLFEAVSRTAELLGNVKTQPAEVGDLVPDLGERLLGSVHQGAGRGTRALLGEEIADGVG